MKSLIKSSFLLILLMAVFNIGLTNAYAEEVKASETNKIENIDAIPLQCSKQSSLAIPTILNLNSQGFINILVNLDPECEPATIERDDGSIVIISSDCRIAIIPPPST